MRLCVIPAAGFTSLDDVKRVGHVLAIPIASLLEVSRARFSEGNFVVGFRVLSDLAAGQIVSSTVPPQPRDLERRPQTKHSRYLT